MFEISFFLPVIPYGKGRPKFGRTCAGLPTTYTPKKTRDVENQIKFYSRMEAMKLRHRHFDGPLEAHVVFYIPRPKTVETRIYPTIKPDLDNLEKCVFDSLNEIIYKDDVQIVKCISMKLYADKGQPPGIVVKIKQLITDTQNENRIARIMK